MELSLLQTIMACGGSLCERKVKIKGQLTKNEVIVGGEYKSMASIEPEPKHKKEGFIGKCPTCDESLSRNDIQVVVFKGGFCMHYLYECKLCQHIIGFSAGREVYV